MGKDLTGKQEARNQCASETNSFFFLIFPPGPFWSLLTFYLFFTSLHCFSVLHFIRFVSGPEHTPAKWPTKQGPGSER